MRSPAVLIAPRRSMMTEQLKDQQAAGGRSKRRGVLRIARWMLGVAALQSVSLYLLSELLAGFVIRGVVSVVASAVVFTAAQAVTWPILYRIAARFHPLLFPLLSFALTGLLVVLLSDLIRGIGVNMHVAGIGTGVLIVVGATMISTLLGAFFSLRDDAAYDWFVMRPLRNRYAGTPTTEEPGIIFVEIDGLPEPVLRRAVREGWMPFVRRWLETGSHRLIGWEPDLSSQTSASQAGILLGDNTDIPAFRWFDRETNQLMVTSHIAAARELERRLSTGKGLLLDGASRWNVFSGDARDALLTYSTIGVAGHGGSRRYLAWFANPYTLSRTLALYIGDVLRERWQAIHQGFVDERPRIRRTFGYAFVRAATTTIMQEIALFMLIADMYRGVPAVYATFFAYDEVAHHSGIDRRDAFKVLERLDHAIATLARAATSAPRPYHLVVLSDHGQSMGPTFRQEHGQTLGAVVSSLVHPEARVMEDRRPAEDWGHLRVAFAEAMEGRYDQRTSRLIRRAFQRVDRDSGRQPVPTGQTAGEDVAQAADASDVLVLASGNLGLVSFRHWPERMSYEQLVDHVPRLIPGLIAHPGIGFIMVNSSAEGGLVIGPRGIFYLDHGYAAGDDPLAPYGPNAANHLRRTNGFATAPDILVMSRYDPESGEVNAFEELVGSHGGLGGPQTEPFLLYPATLDPGEERIVGAAALHQVLKRWVTSSSRIQV